MSTTSRKRFIRAFMSSALGTAFSRFFGAFRDIAVSHLLGAAAASDAFFIAFTIPNVFRRFVADEGLTGALIPALDEADRPYDEKERPAASTKQLANAVFTALLLVNLLLCGLGIFFAEEVVLAFAWSYGKDPDQFELTVSMTRWLFPFLTMVSMVSFFEGLLNYRNHFFVPKLAPGIVNLGIVICVFTVAPHLEKPVYALVAGVLVGGAAHVFIHFPWLSKLWGKIRISFDFSQPGFRRISSELLKVVAIGIFAQINILVLRQLASMLEAGAVTQYWNATRVVDLAQGVIAVAIGSALLPNISRSVVNEDWSQFKQDFVDAIRLAAFLLFPAAAFLFAFALPSTSLLFRHGQYTWLATTYTAQTLQFMVPFMLSIAALNIVKKVYFALNDRRSLIIIGGFGVVLTGALGVPLLDSLGVAGLGLALSLSTVVQVFVYVALLWYRLRDKLGLSQLVKPLFLMAFSALIIAVILHFIQRLGDWSLGPMSLMNIFITLIGGGLAATVYAGLAYCFRFKELMQVIDKLKRRFGKKNV